MNSAKVAANSLTAANLAASSVGNSELDSNAVRRGNIDFLSGLSATDFTAIPASECPFGTARQDLPDCDEVLPGSYCEYDFISGVTLNGSLDNCPGSLDVYIRTSW